ncbi:MAG TPA: TonB-dependent receptor [Candidatus Aquabacterium excrementipullorum]|nr:TonB-dependent receptor [Candidatus Aquabacterium excrementipullorum]
MAQSALEPVVVTATRTPVAASQVLSDVTVYTRKDIERQGAGAVADLLRLAPGFEMGRSGGSFGTTSLFVRGADTRHTAVLIDGVRVDSQSTGGATWEALPLDQIERIEIVRGPDSVIYGSDAIGGVVQIFTRKGEGQPRLELGVGAGSRGLAKADASLSGRSGAIDYAVSAATERSDGFNAIVSPTNSSYNPDDDGYRNHNASARVGLDINKAHRLEVSALTQHVNAQYDGYASTDDDHAVHDLDTARLAWSAQWLDNWHSDLSAGESKLRYETRPSAYVTETRVRSYAWNNQFSFGEHLLTALLERREDELENTGLSSAPTAGEGDRSQNAVGLGYAWRHQGYALQFNARQDDDSQFGSHTTGGVAGGLELGAGWNLRGAWGTAFRAPTLYQQYSASGNPNLKPETSRNAEVGLRFRQGGFEAGATVYRNKVRDLISYDAPGICADSWGCYRNTGRAVLKGLTLDAKGSIGPVRLAGSVDFSSPKDAETDEILLRRARRHASLRADTDAGAWTFGAQWLVSDKRQDFDYDSYSAKTLGGYAVLNLDVQYRISDQWRVLLRVDNVADKDYQTSYDYASVPRTVFVGLRWAPKF